MRNVFLDTEVFVHENFSYTSARFQGLLALVRDSDVAVKLTDVTVQEIRSKIEELLPSAEAALKQARKKARLFHNLPRCPVHGLFQPLDMGAAKAELMMQFSRFLEQWSVEIVSTQGVSVGGVFDAYFRGAAPFTGKSKPQFPDAFALAAMELWCEQNSTSACVVSDDSDFMEACGESRRLTHLPSLNALLELVLTETEEERVALALRLFEDHHAELVEALSKSLELEPALLEEEDADATITGVSEALFESVTVLSLNPDGAVLEARAKLTVEAEVSFVDPDTEIYDADDKLAYSERVEGWVNVDVEAPIQFTITYARDGSAEFQVRDVRVNNGEPMYLDI